MFNRFRPVGLTGLLAGLTGLSVGLTDTGQIQFFFFFGLNSNACKVYWMNVCITYFSLNEPSNPLLYYFYIVFVYFVCTLFFNFKSSQTILNERIFEKKIDTIRFVAPWSIFMNFFEIFHFFEFKFEFWIWAGLVPAQTETGPVWLVPPVL